ncbi:MAG: selenocysteine-specific translation elongation factor [Candidatus Sumerlaeia bacterium]
MAKPPGFLSSALKPDVIMMICTAGHVDHGKTALVKLLTGCMTDRLKEEIERGLTIELGFAPCWLGGNLCVGIVDVPGHEKFIKNMVAGVSGIDFTVLVIAADDGVMPQTIEHLEIMRLLGVRRGMVALTKIDLVSPEMLETRVEEIKGFLSGTFLEGAPICPVSSVTSEGYDDFYKTLVSGIKALAARRRSGIFRMPIERVFSREGFGVVLSGIPIDGAIAVGDEVEVVPGGRRGRIRRMECFGRDAERGGCGQCLAINVPALAKDPPHRGQVMTVPGFLKEAGQAHIRFEAISRLEKPIENAEAVKLHIGTSEIPGKIYLLGDKELGGGAKGLATVVLDQPAAAAPGDRFILRRPSPAMTVAGGSVLATEAGTHRASRQAVHAHMQELVKTLGDAEPEDEAWTRRRIEFALRRELPAGASVRELAAAALRPLRDTTEALAALAAEKRVLALSDQFYIHAEQYEACRAEATRRVKQSGEALSLNIAQLRDGLDWAAPVWARIEQDLAAQGLIRQQGAKVVLSAAAEKFNERERVMLRKLEETYRLGGYKSPRPDEIPQLLGIAPPLAARLIEHLANEQKLIALNKQVILTYGLVKAAQDRVVAMIGEKGALNSADFKYVIDSSRKYALAILDWLDERRITVRIGNDRKLAAGYQERLLK